MGYGMVCNVLPTNDLTESRRKVLELHQKGLTPREISKVLDISTQMVYKQLKKLGLTPQKVTA